MRLVVLLLFVLNQSVVAQPLIDIASLNYSYHRPLKFTNNESSTLQYTNFFLTLPIKNGNNIFIINPSFDRFVFRLRQQDKHYMSGQLTLTWQHEWKNKRFKTAFIFIPKSISEEVKNKLVKEVQSMKIGPVEDFRNFVNAVIDEKSFDKISAYIENAKKSKNVTIIAGGNFDKSKGYFIEPTIILTTDPKYTTMCEEIFGPVLTMYVYEDDKFEETLQLVDNTSEYALTGAVISQDRYAVDIATKALVNSAGNFYINDKCTGAVVGQQPFGGARGSGTNDKAGAMVNLLRWVSPRTIKETFVPAKDYRYPFMESE